LQPDLAVIGQGLSPLRDFTLWIKHGFPGFLIRLSVSLDRPSKVCLGGVVS